MGIIDNLQTILEDLAERCITETMLFGRTSKLMNVPRRELKLYDVGLEMVNCDKYTSVYY